MGLYFLLLSSLVLGTSALWPHQCTKPYHSFISAFHAIKSAPTVTLPCVICGIAVNEVEALLADNMTQTAIEQFINSTVKARRTLRDFFLLTVFFFFFFFVPLFFQGLLAFM